MHDVIFDSRIYMQTEVNQLVVDGRTFATGNLHS